MNKIKKIAALIYFLSVFTSSTSWKPPETYGIYSDSTEYMARITPAELGHEKSTPKAEIYKINGKRVELERLFTLVNDVSPSSAYLSDNGILVTLRDWANISEGHDLVIYSK